MVIALASVPLCTAAAPQCHHPAGNVPFGLMGDINASGAVNVADALCVVINSLIFASDPTSPAWHACLSGPAERLDLNCDLSIDVSDTLIVVSLAQGHGLPSGLPLDADGCPAGCAPCVAPGQGSCLIAGACVPGGDPHPDTACRVCVPSVSPTSYVNAAPGTPCGADEECQAGQCVAGGGPEPSGGPAPAGGGLGIILPGPLLTELSGGGNHPARELMLWYVDAEGGGDGSSIDQPTTIDVAAAQSGPGDVIVLLASSGPIVAPNTFAMKVGQRLVSGGEGGIAQVALVTGDSLNISGIGPRATITSGADPTVQTASHTVCRGFTAYSTSTHSHAKTISSHGTTSRNVELHDLDLEFESGGTYSKAVWMSVRQRFVMAGVRGPFGGGWNGVYVTMRLDQPTGNQLHVVGNELRGQVDLTVLPASNDQGPLSLDVLVDDNHVDCEHVFWGYTCFDVNTYTPIHVTQTWIQVDTRVWRNVVHQGRARIRLDGAVGGDVDVFSNQIAVRPLNAGSNFALRVEANGHQQPPDRSHQRWFLQSNVVHETLTGTKTGRGMHITAGSLGVAELHIADNRFENVLRGMTIVAPSANSAGHRLEIAGDGNLAPGHPEPTTLSTSYMDVRIDKPNNTVDVCIDWETPGDASIWFGAGTGPYWGPDLQQDERDIIRFVGSTTDPKVYLRRSYEQRHYALHPSMTVTVSGVPGADQRAFIDVADEECAALVTPPRSAPQNW